MAKRLFFRPPLGLADPNIENRGGRSKNSRPFEKLSTPGEKINTYESVVFLKLPCAKKKNAGDRIP